MRHVEQPLTEPIAAAVGGIVAGDHDAAGSDAASEQWFRVFVQRASDVIVVLGPDARVMYANPAAERLLRSTTRDNSAVFAHLHPDDRDRVATVFAEIVRAAGTSHPLRFRIAAPDGGWRVLDAVADNCLDDPAIAGVVLHARDVTDAEQSRDALHASESLLREAQRIAHVGHWTKNIASGCVEWLSEEMYAIHGLSHDAWMQRDYIDLVMPEDREAAMEAYRMALTHGAGALTHRIVRPDGTVRHVRTRAETQYGSNGQPTRLVGTCQDVTDQVEMRHALSERLKEQTCLATVSRAMQAELGAAELCAVAGAAILLAMPQPELSVVAVSLDGSEHRTAEVAGALEMVVVPVGVAGHVRGHVRVSCIDGADAFLPQKRHLVDCVSGQIAVWLEADDSVRALADSEARLRRLVDNATDVIFRYRYGEDEGFDYLSPSVEALTGYTAREMMADREIAGALIGGSAAQGVQDPVRALAVDGTGKAPTAVPLLTRDGACRWAELSLVPVHDALGNQIAVEGVARDVTDRVSADAELGQRALEQAALARVGEAALTADGIAGLLETAVILVTETLSLDAAAVYQIVPESEELLLSIGAGWPDGIVGLTRIPLAETSMAASAISQNAPVVIADLAEGAAVAAPFLGELGFVSAASVVIGGRDKPFGVLAAYGVTAREHSSERVQFLQTLAHILGEAIERTHAEEAVERSEREFRTLAENLPDIVARFDRDHRHLYVNPRVQATLGLSPAELIGRTNRELGLPHTLVEEWEAAAEQVFASGEPTAVEGIYPQTQGTTHLQSLMIPEFDADGQVHTVVGVTRDITSLRRAEEQRREGLGRIVAAQEEERARISEDIHDDSIQVMTAVGMRLDTLRSTLTDPASINMLERLEEGVRHSINRLRALMFELRPPELDREGLTPALRLYLEATATEGLPLCEVIDNCSLELPVELRSVLYRIALEAITNARKHAEAFHLEVIFDPIDDGVRMQVRDDGRGFATADLAQVGPHHLGTTTMRERASAAGGSLHIESAAAEGTVVTVWLPLPRHTALLGSAGLAAV